MQIVKTGNLLAEPIQIIIIFKQKEFAHLHICLFSYLA